MEVCAQSRTVQSVFGLLGAVLVGQSNRCHCCSFVYLGFSSFVSEGVVMMSCIEREELQD